MNLQAQRPRLTALRSQDGKRQKLSGVIAFTSASKIVAVEHRIASVRIRTLFFRSQLMHRLESAGILETLEKTCLTRVGAIRDFGLFLAVSCEAARAALATVELVLDSLSPETG